MVLYVCDSGTTHGDAPGPFAHPCGRAARALDKTGHSYELKTAAGGLMKPWTWPSRARDRAEVKELSGKNGVPILVLDNGDVVAGSGEIVRWTEQNPPAA